MVGKYPGTICCFCDKTGRGKAVTKAETHYLARLEEIRKYGYLEDWLKRSVSQATHRCRQKQKVYDILMPE